MLFVLVGLNEKSAALTINRSGGTFRVDKVTTYSGACAKDSTGGGNQTASMIGSPANFTADGKADQGVAVVATTQEGGTKDLFGCFFTMKEKPGKLFFAGDKYAPSGNGVNKIDVSMSCDNYKNQDFTSGGAEIKVLNCSPKNSNDSAHQFFKTGIDEAKKLAGNTDSGNSENQASNPPPKKGGGTDCRAAAGAGRVHLRPVPRKRDTRAGGPRLRFPPRTLF